eukprot:6464563-Amphidinium_carterae.1
MGLAKCEGRRGLFLLVFVIRGAVLPSWSMVTTVSSLENASLHVVTKASGRMMQWCLISQTAALGEQQFTSKELQHCNTLTEIASASFGKPRIARSPLSLWKASFLGALR